jgi:hypothetical protein
MGGSRVGMGFEISREFSAVQASEGLKFAFKNAY